ncbi:iron complex outermembrane receptor protein [Novosphingobium hassiacum]|uniref:Iron complex outermembrane receptor protein n=1 Tax=Novosphingobium hassiacum TaxID=173676 RepID=A0A7W5ZYT5_9SPHN|nr:TonB-dependent receptor [Novosphingobium hassiacum]MBB3861583.1 iron complex outermembrane receptor protein [Novosphingobium hassiacum]
MKFSTLLASCSALTLATPAFAEEPTPDQDNHAQPSDQIVVTAAFERNRQDIISGVSVIQGEELTQALRPTLGETLNRTPGVSATSFGPNASRPVLRGLQGERVRILTDGVGAFDVSNTSADHAVVINPLLAERIEVLRGPATLLYGSSAIGGVVNVIDKRIPRVIPDEIAHVDMLASYGSASNERSIGGAVDVPVGDKFVVHADGSYLKTGNQRIGDYVLAPSARLTALANAGTETEDQLAEGIDFAASAGLRGKLPNSAAETWTAGVGAALITDTGNLGIAYSHYDSLYGIPVRYAIRPGEEQEGPRLDVAQDRLDLRAEVQTGGSLIQSIKARAGFASYRHFELEPDGGIGTAFYNKGLEGRVELVQADRGPWKGASGVQYFSRDFNVIGDEAFLPKNSTQQLGVFTLQQLDFGALKLEGGARYEHTVLEARPLLDQTQFFSGKRTFDTVSGSVGASYGFTPDWRFGVNLSRTVRAPSAEELFANGPHAGTQAFEVGSPDFHPERAWGLEAVLRGKGTGYSFEASAYHNWFDNFIFEDLTGAVEDGLPVYQFGQAKARYYGFEVQGNVTLAKLGSVELVADGLADYVHANIVGFGPAPRIPPLRVQGGLGLNGTKVDLRGEVEWSDSQTRTTAFETQTASFTLVNAQLNFRPWGTERPLSFALSANNIFDVDARRHASFLKDFAPLAGRDIRITARASF